MYRRNPADEEGSGHQLGKKKKGILAKKAEKI